MGNARHRAGGGGGAVPTLLAHTAAAPLGYPGSTTTMAIDTTGANFIVIAAENDQTGGTTNTISDSAVNPWTRIAAVHISGGGCALYYCASPTTSATHTFTNSTTQYDTGLAVQAWSGINATPFTGQYGDTSATSTSGLASAVIAGIGDLVVIALGSAAAIGVSTATVLPSGFVFTDAIDPAGFSENHIMMGYAIYDGTPATTVPVWSSTITYSATQVVSDGAGNFYLSGYNYNTNHVPSAGGGWWTSIAAAAYSQPMFSYTGDPSITTASFAKA